MENKSALVAIKRNSDFIELKKEGKRHWPSQWLLLNFRKNNDGQIRYGVTVSRKVGSAVTRNRMKRWVREYFKATVKSESIPEVDVNVIFKPMGEEFYKKLTHTEFVLSMDKGLLFILKTKS